MATRVVKTKFEVDGEREFKAAISEINAGLKVLDSEMNKVTAEYEGNEKSVEALTKKGDILERKFMSQKDKVDEYRAELQKLAEQYGEADKRTMAAQTNLNNAEAALTRTENAIRENRDALEDALVPGEKMGDVLGDLAGKFGVSLPEGIQTSLNSLGKFSTGSVAAIGAVTAAVAALVATYQKLITMTTEAAANADNILTMSQITGLDTESIQELEYASELIDVSFDTISGAMSKMKRTVDDAASGTGAVADAYTRLGVQVTDSTGQFRDAEEIFYDLIDALGRVENATERDNLSMQIFGKSAQDLNPLIVQGSSVLREYAEEAHEMSAVLSKEQLSALGAVDDAYQRLQNTQEATRNQMAAQLAPAVEDFYTKWTELIQTASEQLIDSGVMEYLGSILTSVTDILKPVGELIATVLPQLFRVLKPVAEVLALIADTVNLIIGLLPTNWGSGMATTALGWNIGSGQMSNIQQLHYSETAGYTGQVYDSAAGGYVGNYYNAAGDYNWKGGLTWVGENGPELVSLPAGSQINNAQDSRNMGGDVYNISIDARSVKEFNDIVRIAQQSRVTARMRG